MICKAGVLSAARTTPSVVAAVFVLLLLHFVDERNAVLTSPYHHISTEKTGAVGPETIAFDCEGRGPYTGLSDGRVLRWDESTAKWIHFVTPSPYWNRSCFGTNEDERERMCGRPLGLKFNEKTCELYIADAYFGLNVVYPGGENATQLAIVAEGVPFKFTNAVDIDHDTGVVYFTDTSTVYTRLEYETVIETKDKTGRLIRYDPKTGELKVLLRGLAFANGVALSKDKRFLLVAETTMGRVLKYWLMGPKSGDHEVFMQLAGLPDNINSDEDGNFWIAQVPLAPFSDNECGDMKCLQLGSEDKGLPVKVDEYGKVLEVLNEEREEEMVVGASDVKSAVGRLWVGSVVYPYAAFKKLDSYDTKIVG